MNSSPEAEGPIESEKFMRDSFSAAERCPKEKTVEHRWQEQSCRPKDRQFSAADRRQSVVVVRERRRQRASSSSERRRQSDVVRASSSSEHCHCRRGVVESRLREFRVKNFRPPVLAGKSPIFRGKFGTVRKRHQRRSIVINRISSSFREVA